ncbi:MAG TPA: HAMP domain-containing sensor histidine kinase, partial [Rheinheimera sp.]|uniref:sensor histidine kinase n=1 Tax=Rheinheimera sp. TaxID=1869214 RepID=UPI002B48699F
RLRRLDGEFYDGYITAAKPVDLEGYRQVMVSVLDITKYKRDSQLLAEAKERLARVQSVITAGTLAASIAHEINSTLAAVTANSAACVRWINKDPPDIHEASIAASAALDAVERTQVVVNKTKSYFSRVKGERKSTDLGKIIRDSLKLIEREIVELDVKLVISVEDGLFVFCDPVQIQQVFINLCSNAMQAMKTIDKRSELIIGAVREGNSIAVRIQDNGPGIDDSLIDKIFEPFYTTKEEGMGMGLAICRSCIENHGGWIVASSDIGEGALFKLTLPNGNRNEQCKS